LNLCVVIVNDPQKGIHENNLKVHEGNGKRCQHLRGNKPGEYFCIIHNESWYDQTPCYQFTQVERDSDTECRLGKYFLSKDKPTERINETPPKQS